MLILRDNTKYSSTSDNLEKYLSLQNIANRNVSELLDDKDNDLLIYPHSFYQCEDETGKQPLLLLQTHWKEKKCTKVMLETGNMAGFIGFNGLSLSIHSRFSQDSKEDFFLHYMLSKVFCINVLNLSHGTSDEQLFNFLLYMFPKFLNEALSQGLYKEYKRNEYNDANVRGTIDINRHLRSNMPFNGRVAYRTREFSHDNHVTELIRHTIDYISKSRFGRTLLENDSETRTSVTQIISATPNYCRQERESIVKSNLKVINHPYYSRYTPLQKLCLRILRHEKIKYGEMKNKIHGILFDVSYLWEEYLATILTKQGFQHPNNRKGLGCIYLAEYNRLPRYPDYYREYDRLIVDAKYKKDTNRDDIHQMITYMYQMKGKRGIFIQPGDKEYQKETFHLLGYGYDESAELQTYIYPISRITDNYKSFVSEILKSEESLKTRFKQNLESYE